MSSREIRERWLHGWVPASVMMTRDVVGLDAAGKTQSTLKGARYQAASDDTGSVFARVGDGSQQIRLPAGSFLVLNWRPKPVGLGFGA